MNPSAGDLFQLWIAVGIGGLIYSWWRRDAVVLERTILSTIIVGLVFAFIYWFVRI